MDNPSKGSRLRGKIPVTLLAIASLCMELSYLPIRICTAQGSGFKLADVLLVYGNGTRVWTSCILQLGNDTVYDATRLVASSLNVTWYDGLALVDAINGVWNSHPYYWIWWYWNSSESRWAIGPTACNQYTLEDCDMVAWYYEDCSSWPPNPPPSPPVTKVDILLDYGNNTRAWYENVELPGFPSVLKATKAVASVNYTMWDTDAFVNAINNVWNSDPYYWIWWYWNHSAKCWESGAVACNKYTLVSGDIIAWYYLNWHVWQPPSQTPHPTASFSWTPSIPKTSEAINFDASASTPNGGTIINYAWDFGDGSTANGKIVVHSYKGPGTYIVTLNVTDSNGLWDIEQKQITVVQPYGPKADFKAIPQTARVGERIKFDASASLLGWNGTHNMPITEYRWNFGDGNITVTNQPIIYHSYGAAGNYYVTLTVYAPGATPETDSTTVKVTVFAVPVGGQSTSLKTPTTGKDVTTHLAFVVVITAVFIVIKRKWARE